MSEQITIEIIRLTPAIVAILLIAIGAYVFRGPLRELLSRTSGVGMFGFRLDFHSREMASSLTAARPETPVSNESAAQLFASANDSSQLLARCQVLWVDDEPRGNLVERRWLHRLGVFVDLETTTDGAIQALKTAPRRNPYDLVISDIARGNENHAGMTMLDEFEKRGIRVPVVFYVTKLRPDVPKGAEGITNRPDELLHMVLDILRRVPAAGEPKV